MIQKIGLIVAVLALALGLGLAVDVLTADKAPGIMAAFMPATAEAAPFNGGLPYGMQKLTTTGTVDLTGASEFFVLTDGECQVTVVSAGATYPVAAAGDGYYTVVDGVLFAARGSQLGTLSVTDVSGTYFIVGWR